MRRAGRRFTLDLAAAIRLAWALYVDVESTSALQGEDEEATLRQVRTALSEVLAAITEPV